MIINHKNDRSFNDDSITTITENCDKKESIASIFKSRTDTVFRKLVDKLEQAEITRKLKETEN